jgi:multiple sugar transport system substrate-binding protein
MRGHGTFHTIRPDNSGRNEGVFVKLKGIWLLFLLGILVCAGLALKFFYKNRTATQISKTVSLAHDKGNLPIFQTNFTLQGIMAEKATRIGITPVPSVTPDLYRHQMKAVLSTDQAPELFVWWPSFRAKELIGNQWVSDLTALWDKHASDYSPEMRNVFTSDGKVYGFPYVVEYWPVWYNKTVFKRLGLAPPTTWDEFIHVCEVLKGANVTPILSSLQNDWSAFIWFEEMIIGEDPDLYNDLCLGRVHYTDPRILKACLVWKDMIAKGYFSEPSLNMLTNSGYLWNNEKFAMALCGTWYYSAVLVAQGVDEQSIGNFILPSHNPRAGKNIIFEVGPLYTAKNAPGSHDALKVADWWMGRDGSAYFARLQSAYPCNLKTDTSYLPPSKKRLIEEIKSENYRLINRYWEATPTPICENAVLKIGEFILDPDKLQSTLKDIDRIAVAYWTDNPN